MTTLGVFRDDFYNYVNTLPMAKFTSNALASGVVPASVLAGATEVYYTNTAATALTTDSAVNLINQILTVIQQSAQGAQPAVSQIQGLTYTLYVRSTGAGLTITAGTGVTITGTATVATNVERQYLVTITSPTTVGFQDLGGAAVT